MDLLAKQGYEFVAVFDADFKPEPGFLQRTVPYLMGNPEVWGCRPPCCLLLPVDPCWAAAGSTLLDACMLSLGWLGQGRQGARLRRRRQRRRS